MPQAAPKHPGKSRENGWALLELLRLNGWDVAATMAFAGGEGDGPPKALVLASDSLGHDIRVEGASIAEAALVVFEECTRRRRLTFSQLRLVA